MNYDPVGTIMAWIGVYGLVGLFAVALAERFVPVMPSYGLLLAVGIGAADGAWSLPAAFLSTVAGSLFGCVALFYALRGLGAAQSTRLLHRAGRLFGISVDRIDRASTAFHRNQTALAFALQLVPTIRLFAPAFAALLRENSHSFLAASAAGIGVWNGLFIGIGYYASHSIETTNMTVLALGALGCLLIAEAVLFLLARRVRARRKTGAALCGT
ncbi:VTT domain-containing protein [Rhizobium sp. LC145]|uniref:DedA family protein n=1 Tax=Rhizobium sp. LC145 TaxID=1120688 RepID=UPI000629F17D|nr:VTT domain-containing protein [Rhizobium sp. LC145]KKX25038.1 hypothetical protein YH62_26175 [Rhizobium sp. LC145]TKT55106.1 membrane-associated protein [Rhizobiaceae bacterium LC148]